MHHTAIVRRGRTRHRVWSTLLCALALLGAAQLAPAALAAAKPSNGGPVAADCPTTVANDHTVYALRFTALSSGPANPLPPNSQYYVKLRFTPSPDGKPAGIDNRGYTWNPGEKRRSRGVDPGTGRAGPSSPTVTTDATGAIVPLARTHGTSAGSGTSARPAPTSFSCRFPTGASGTTKNSDAPLSVNVISMTARRRATGCTTARATGKVGQARGGPRPCSSGEPHRLAAHRSPTSVTTTATASSTTSSTAP